MAKNQFQMHIFSDSSKDNFIAKSSRLSTKRNFSIFLNFLFPFVSFIGVFSILKCKTLVLKTTTWWTRASHFLDEWHLLCLVPVRRFPSPSRSICFSNVSEANGWEKPSHFHGPRGPQRFGRAEKWGLGTRQTSTKVQNSPASSPPPIYVLAHLTFVGEGGMGDLVWARIFFPNLWS